MAADITGATKAAESRPISVTIFYPETDERLADEAFLSAGLAALTVFGPMDAVGRPVNFGYDGNLANAINTALAIIQRNGRKRHLLVIVTDFRYSSSQKIEDLLAGDLDTSRILFVRAFGQNSGQALLDKLNPNRVQAVDADELSVDDVELQARIAALLAAD